MARNNKSIIVISSHVARGSIGNRAAVFALEVLSFPVWAIPTVILPWHPGHGKATRITPQKNEFECFLKDITNANWIGEVGAVLSGYMANANQAKQVAKLVEKLKVKNPDLVYLCDPVIGDEGRLYIEEEAANTIRDTLIPLCDITTPNRFELSWLTGRTPTNKIEDIKTDADHLPPKEVLVTSCLDEKNNSTGNLLKTPQGTFICTHDSIPDAPKGPGDLSAALYLGQHLLGVKNPDALSNMTSSVYEILQHSHSAKSDELTLSGCANAITNPNIKLEATQLK